MCVVGEKQGAASVRENGILLDAGMLSGSGANPARAFG
ncbi:hypothetical protein HNQ38_000663 [Desulfovibrio intestinalis]|uniref:Uncharacterized protein n=1 Tax=Desulfovibrio intestinalis TaxID=58621 RepID=A0A7W8C1C1_9BACT|nr:hypothetical protein [Desulfovibrio intestinalis]